MILHCSSHAFFPGFQTYETAKEMMTWVYPCICSRVGQSSQFSMKAISFLSPGGAGGVGEGGVGEGVVTGDVEDGVGTGVEGTGVGFVPPPCRHCGVGQCPACPFTLHHSS